MTNSIFNRFCCHCGRTIDLSELMIDEGRDYHEHCHLSVVRSRISMIEKKAQRGTATQLDIVELRDLRFLNEVGKLDAQDAPGAIALYDKDHPCFKGNTALGSHCAMTAHIRERRRKEHPEMYHVQVPHHVETGYRPVMQITTDENGQKGCIQIGERPATTEEINESAQNYNNLEIFGYASKQLSQELFNLKRLPIEKDLIASPRNSGLRGYAIPLRPGHFRARKVPVEI